MSGFPFGLDEDWSETDYGQWTVYQADPALIPAAEAARVIYELRLDVARLAGEAASVARRS